MQDAIRVLCVDDSPDVVDVLRIILSGERGIECLPAAHSAEEFAAAAAHAPPCIAIVDLTMPGPLASIDAIRRVSRAHPHIRVIAYSGYDDEDTRSLAVDAGAWGFVSKNAGPDTLVKAVRRVAAGDAAL